MGYSGDVPTFGKETIDPLLLQVMKDVHRPDWRRGKRSFVTIIVFVVLARRCTNYLTYRVTFCGSHGEILTYHIEIEMPKICRMRR